MGGKFSVLLRGSRAAECLECAWRMLRAIDPRIPPTVIVVLPADARKRKAGHFAGCRWKTKRKINAHEVAVSPNLFEYPENLLATLLHEAAHAILYKDRLAGGCGSGGYYHRHEFRDICRQLGLECEFLNGRYGWTITHWPEQDTVPHSYRRVLRFLERSLPAGTGARRPFRIAGKKTPNAGHTRLVCGCPGDGRSIYVKKSVLEEGGVMCGKCGKAFQPKK